MKKIKKKLVLKPFVVPTLYTVFSLVVIISLFLSIDIKEEKDNLTYVSNAILDEYVPVVNISNKIIRPYADNTVVKTKDYYEYQSSDENQKSSIILHNNTYIQNTGINYSSDKPFDVLSILNGEVIEVKEKELLGTNITIKHDNNMISVYDSIKDVKVKKGDYVTTGQVIATSGICDLIKEKENNLHFELYVNGVIENPENYYDKEVR